MVNHLINSTTSVSLSKDLLIFHLRWHWLKLDTTTSGKVECANMFQYPLPIYTCGHNAPILKEAAQSQREFKFKSSLVIILFILQVALQHIELSSESQSSATEYKKKTTRRLVENISFREQLLTCRSC